MSGRTIHGLDTHRHFLWLDDADWFVSAVMAFLDDKSWVGVAVDLNHT
jgi:hypothetical protein